MICACCGFEINGEPHKISRGYVCDSCWNDPNNFFPEKMSHLERWEIFSKMFQSENLDAIEVPVVRIKQKNLTLYTGKLRAKNLLKMYGFCGFEEETLSGYQREIYEEKINDIYEYLVKCPMAVLPSIFISLRNGAQFKSIYPSSLSSDDLGTLTIQLKKGSIWIIDGQHRVGGFEKVLGNIALFKESKFRENDEFVKLMDYELPVIFIDSYEAAIFFNHNERMKTSAVDIERTIFFIINKTQNRISPSLKDALQYSIKMAGVNGIPVIDREEWRTEATSLIIKLNNLKNSPFLRKFNMSGARGLGRPVQLYSFVSSLKPLFMSDIFKKLDSDEKLLFLLTFWETVKSMNPKAFSENSYKDYLILKTIGIYSLNLLCSDYLNWCREKNLDLLEKDNVKVFLNPISNFDWRRSTSHIAHFGGLSGVREVHSILSQKTKETSSSNQSVQCNEQTCSAG